MESKNVRFLLGLGLGSVLGMVLYRCSKTEKAKELKEKVCNKIKSVGEQAGEWMCDVKDKEKEK